MTDGLDARFAALAHPFRRSMFARLLSNRRTISDLAGGATMTFAAVSRHLRVLESAGLVRRDIHGRDHWFTADPAALASAERWIARQARRWQTSLDALKAEIEQGEEVMVASPLRANAEVYIAAPPEKVFSAWLDPKRAKRFLCAGDTSVSDIRLDPRPGGELFLVMTKGELRILHRGEFLVVDPPRRLMFTWVSQPTDLRLTIVSVDFIPERGGTTVRLAHEGFDRADSASAHSHGWQSILAKLSPATAG